MKLNIVDKRLRELTREEFETNMKALMRWAKENNYYVTLRNYIDNKDVIYKRLQSISYTGDFTFSDALGLFAFVETNYKKLGSAYWDSVIVKIYKSWKAFYEAKMFVDSYH